MAEKNSAIYRGSKRAGLEHWVGPTQHIGDGVSTDPKSKRPPKAGPTKGGLHPEDGGVNGD